MAPIYLIQGTIFQKELWPKILTHSGRDIGVLIYELFPFTFWGILYPNKYGELGEYIGKMKDNLGESILFKIFLSPARFEFEKKYLNRDDIIKYWFVKKNGVWIGGYSGQKTDEGDAKCTLTKVSADFFLSPMHT